MQISDPKQGKAANELPIAGSLLSGDRRCGERIALSSPRRAGAGLPGHSRIPSGDAAGAATGPASGGANHPKEGRYDHAHPLAQSSRR